MSRRWRGWWWASFGRVRLFSAIAVLSTSLIRCGWAIIDARHHAEEPAVHDDERKRFLAWWVVLVAEGYADLIDHVEPQGPRLCIEVWSQVRSQGLVTCCTNDKIRVEESSLPYSLKARTFRSVKDDERPIGSSSNPLYFDIKQDLYAFHGDFPWTSGTASTTLTSSSSTTRSHALTATIGTYSIRSNSLVQEYRMSWRGLIVV